MRHLTFLLIALCWLAGTVLAGPELEIPEESTQLIVVTSRDWDATVATMAMFERTGADSEWRKKGGSVTVNLGRTGLAWGSSPLMETVGPGEGGGVKKEGDGRSPAGIFPILRAFGHPHPPAGYGSGNLPFLLVNDEQCVDDGSSRYYNEIVSPREVGGVTWDSAERMKIDLYRLGLVVGHNCPKASPGLGSCIFFHLQKAPGSPTAGCTSMSSEALERLVLWLKKDAHPVLLQLPEKVYGEFEEFPEL